MHLSYKKTEKKSYAYPIYSSDVTLGENVNLEELGRLIHQNLALTGE